MQTPTIHNDLLNNSSLDNILIVYLNSALPSLMSKVFHPAHTVSTTQKCI